MARYLEFYLFFIFYFHLLISFKHTFFTGVDRKLGTSKCLACIKVIMPRKEKYFIVHVKNNIDFTLIILIK